MADGRVVFEIEGDTSGFDSKVAKLGSDADRAVSDGLGSAARAAEKAGGGLFSRIGRMAAAPFDALGAKVSSMFPGLAERFSGLAEGAKAALGKIPAAAGAVFSSLGGLALKAGKWVAAGIGAGLAAIGKFAFDAYGEFEQLSGGAELMFGEGYGYIAEHAADAYRTVQMSQNEYLRQVNGFAVGLRESLGGDERAAAELADRIVTAEADIVSATGNGAEAVQAAFNGVMKGNYSMLDNLGLGIKATKEGMQEVIDKMNEVNGTDYSIDNLADVQNALIDYVSYVGMAGYASMEGATTIQGSVASMKAAWENFLVGLADPDADLGALAGNLVDTVVNAAGTIVPAFVRAVAGAAGQLPGAIAELAPVLATGIAQAVAQAMGMDVHEEEGAGELAMRIVRVVARRISEGFPDVLAGAYEMLGGIGGAIMEITPVLLPMLIDMLLQLVASLPTQIPALLAGALELFGAIGTAVMGRGPEILSTLAGVVGELIGLVIGGVANMIAAGLQFVGGLLTGTEDGSTPLRSFFNNLPWMLFDAMGDIVGFFWDVGGDIIGGIARGVQAAAGGLVDAVVGAASDALGGVASFLGIASPSKVFRDRVGRMIALGMAEGVESGYGELRAALEGALSIERGSLERLATMPMPAISAAGYGGASLPGIAAAAARGWKAAGSGGWAPELSGKLDRILAAIEAGQVIEVDSRVLGRTVRKAL